MYRPKKILSFKSEANMEQIIAIVTTGSFSSLHIILTMVILFIVKPVVYLCIKDLESVEITIYYDK